MSIARIATGIASCLALMVGGCVTVETEPRELLAIGSLVRSDGAPAGIARVVRAGDGLVLRVEATGLPPGPHGFHIHAIGRCDRPGFTTAQGHWNPSGRVHGSANPAGAHAGDLPNLAVGPDGRGTGEFTLDPGVAGRSLELLLDVDGAALVVHAAADDLRTDPSGNSGARIACGVLARA